MKNAVCCRNLSKFYATLCLSMVLAAASVAYGQLEDATALLADYQKARAAFASKQFQKAADLFYSVASRCHGSELNLQCEYMAALSEWAQEPSDAVAAHIAAWQVKVEKFQSDAYASGRSIDEKLIRQWSDSAQILQAKWDRQKQRIDLAEARLRSYLKPSKEAQSQPVNSPEGWLQLGAILLEDRKDYESAKECFKNAIATCNHSIAIGNQATLGCALACWNENQFAEAREFLTRLNVEKIDDSIAIQSALLEVKIAKALGEALDVSNALKPALQIAAAGNPQAVILYELAMALLDCGENSSSNEVLLKIVHRFPQSPVSIEARVRLAKVACDAKSWKEADQWSSQTLQMDCPQHLLAHVHTIRGQAKLELGDLDRAQADFNFALGQPNVDVELGIVIRFHLAEALYRQEKWKEAEPYWKWLQLTAETLAADKTTRDWLPVVLLRTAELLALHKEWEKAESAVLRIRNDFPECVQRAEVDYLYARCLVSKADFDAARFILGLVTSQQSKAPIELRSRAFWMVGETYLMQRKFEEARIAYQQVLQDQNPKYWQSAALLQIGHCCEAIQDGQGARDAYARLVRDFGDSPFAKIATTRLSLLPNLSIANQLEQESSGTKR